VASGVLLVSAVAALLLASATSARAANSTGVNSYTLSYSGNGSTGGSAPSDPLSPYAYGATVTVLGNSGGLTKTGYRFSGWNTAADGTGTAYSPGDTFSMPAADLTLYAQWAEQISQTIRFAALADKTVAQSPVTVSATASSGLTVTFTTATPRVCTAGGANGATITLHKVGTCTVEADQAGNDTYSPATPVDRSFSVSKTSQRISFAALAGKSLAQSPITMSATASSGLTVTFTTTTPRVCTAGGTHGHSITLRAAGTCTVHASQAGNPAYRAAKPVKRSFTAGGNYRADSDGLVFRYYAAAGWQFQPLLSFAYLNQLLSSGPSPAAERLLSALLSRARHQGDALYWDYRFAYGGPRSWTSGFVQAIAAQALARASQVLEKPSLLTPAGAAFAGLRETLLLHVGGGLWIREYGFTRQVILNSQLQSLLSLESYARVAATPEAEHLVGSLYRTTLRLLPRFDLGCHSLYQLGGPVADHHYQDYHFALLRRLAAEHPLQPIWHRTYARWRRCA
jgi:uncharacterized repeat protein (TIGR02543 family)